MKKKINRMTISDHLIEYQLQMIGKTVQDALKDPEWYNTWTMTSEQYDEFKAYAVPLLPGSLAFTRTKKRFSFRCLCRIYKVL